MMTYLPSLGGYFLHTDDWFWSYWGGFQCSGVVRWILPIGRPLAGLIYCVFPMISDFRSMWLFRLFNVLNIAIIGVLLWIWMVRFKVEGYIAFLLSIMIVCLPAFQVFSSYISTIPHCLAVIPSFLAAFLVDDSFNFKDRFSKFKRHLLAVTFLVISLSLNQANALFYVAVLLVPILMLEGEKPSKNFTRKFSIYGCILACSFAIYYSVFRLSAALFNFRDVGKYDGRNFVTNYSERIRWFWKGPLLETSNLWSIQPKPLIFGVVVLLMIILVLWDLAAAKKGSSLILKYILALAIFPASYGISLVSSNPSTEYRTYSALGSAFVFFLFIGAYSIVKRRCQAQVMEFVSVFFFLVCMGASVVANKTVSEYFVLSDSSEFRFVKNEMRKYLARGQPLKQIHILVAQGPIAAPQQRNEIGEPILRHTPNIEPLILAALSELGIKSRPKITTSNVLEDTRWTELVFDHSTIDLSQNFYPPTKDGVLVIDVSSLRLL
jgi:hypothetical protein